MDDEFAIVIEHLDKHYQDVKALDDLNLQVARVNSLVFWVQMEQEKQQQ